MLLISIIQLVVTAFVVSDVSGVTASPVPFNSLQSRRYGSHEEQVLPRCPNGPKECLSKPKPKEHVAKVVLGVGTQNYNCPASNAATVPVALGANADLYDITNMVDQPNVMHFLTALTQKAELQDNVSAANGLIIPTGLGYPLIGEHYFLPDRKTPVFVLDKDYSHGKKPRKFVGTKLEGIPAPLSSLKGSVPWLLLGLAPGKEKESHGIKNVYRVYTAGGAAPPNCAGKPVGDFTVNYAAEYWLVD